MVAQVINRRPRPGTPLRPSQAQAARFSQEDEHLLSAVADMVAASAHFTTHLTSVLDKHASGGLTPSPSSSTPQPQGVSSGSGAGTSTPAGGGGGGNMTGGGGAGAGSDPGSSGGSVSVGSLLVASARAVPGELRIPGRGGGEGLIPATKCLALLLLVQASCQWWRLHSSSICLPQPRPCQTSPTLQCSCTT
jgi:hypothetical protein